jgi:hypothetical protein
MRRQSTSNARATTFSVSQNDRASASLSRGANTLL